MAFKLVVFSCLLAAAYGSAAPAVVAAYAQPVAARLEEFDPFPQYTYGYSVADSITGDFKTQNERRNGDLVQGSYSLIESDGTRRVVEYEADSVNGFNANVRYETVGAPAVVAEPAVVPARIAAAPVAAVAEPVVAAKVAAPVAAVAPARYAVAPAPVFGRYAAPAAVAAPAPYFARYATSPVAAAPVVARYTSAPFVDARYAATPVVAARYAAAPAPLTYAAPFATASYATYAGPVSGAYTTYTSSGPVAYTAVAPAVAPAAVAPVRAAPAKLVEPVAAAGYRYP